MKRISALAAAVVMTFSVMTACGDTSSSQSSNSSGSSTSSASSASSAAAGESSNASGGSSNASQKSSDILVAYFTAAENGKDDVISSASKANFNGREMGNAAVLATIISEKTGGDLFSIKTVKDYPLDYDELVDHAKQEQKDGELPELETSVDVSAYKTVYVVYPVWWYTMPQAIYSFFDKYDLSGKTLIPVTTHEGSSMADSVDKFKSLEPDAQVKDGYSVRGGSVSSAKEELEKWIDEQG